MQFIGFTDPAVTTNLLVNFISAGIYPPTCGGVPAVGQQCTSPGSLFNFVNNPTSPGGPPQATATWVLSGVTDDGKSTWFANFTSQFGVPFQTVFASLAANGFVADTYSAQITISTVPEPGPSALMGLGLGLIVLSAGLRRQFSRRQQ